MTAHKYSAPPSHATFVRIATFIRYGQNTAIRTIEDVVFIDTFVLTALYRWI